MQRRAILAFLAFLLPMSARADDRIDANLTVEVAADGKIDGEIRLTNHTGRSLCMLGGGWDGGDAFDADGHVLGNPVEFTLLWPDTLEIVWNDALFHYFDAFINVGAK